MLAFLRKPDRGRVTFCGSSVNWSGEQLGRLRKQVTLLHQDSYLFSGTVMANVGFGLRMRGVEQQETRRSVKHFLALVGMAGFEARDATALSGGEARRVALARALACRPEVLLLDEPLAHVDQESSRILENLIASQSRAGTTIVMASHDEHIEERLPSSVDSAEPGADRPARVIRAKSSLVDHYFRGLDDHSNGIALLQAEFLGAGAGDDTFNEVFTHLHDNPRHDGPKMNLFDDPRQTITSG